MGEKRKNGGKEEMKKGRKGNGFGGKAKSETKRRDVDENLDSRKLRKGVTSLWELLLFFPTRPQLFAIVSGNIYKLERLGGRLDYK